MNDGRGDRGGVGIRGPGADPDPAEPSRGADHGGDLAAGRVARGSTRCTRAWPGRIDLTCEPFDADRIAERASVAFLAPAAHGEHGGRPRPAPSAGVRVIDLSADYRLTDAQVYADWYGHAHTDPDGPAPGRLRPARALPRADPAGRPDRQPRLLHLDEHPGPGPADRRGPDRADRDHHRRQERGLGRGPVAEADVPLPRVQREPLGLQRRPASPHARDRPGADRRRPRGRASRSR